MTKKEPKKKKPKKVRGASVLKVKIVKVYGLSVKQKKAVVALTRRPLLIYVVRQSSFVPHFSQ